VLNHRLWPLGGEALRAKAPKYLIGKACNPLQSRGSRSPGGGRRVLAGKKSKRHGRESAILRGSGGQEILTLGVGEGGWGGCRWGKRNEDSHAQPAKTSNPGTRWADG